MIALYQARKNDNLTRLKELIFERQNNSNP